MTINGRQVVWDSGSKQVMDSSYGFFYQILLLLNLYTRIFKPCENGLLACRIHSMVVNLLQSFRNEGQRERSRWVMDATYEIEEPFLSPNSFAGLVLSAERFIVKVWWKGGIISKVLPFHHNGFLGSGNDYIDIIVQPLLPKRSSKESLDRSRDPVKEMVFAGK